MMPFTAILLGNRMVFPGRHEWRHVAKTIHGSIPEARNVGGKVIASGVPTMLYSIAKEGRRK